MAEFIAERYEVGLTADDAREAAVRLAAAASRLRAEGTDLEFLGSTFVPGDEAVLSRFAGASAELVEAAHAAAAVPFERIVAAVAVPTVEEIEHRGRS